MVRIVPPKLHGLGKIAAALGPAETRIVGGAVRDTLAGQSVKDVDLATTHTPDAVIKLLGEIGIKCIPTGIAHGTVTAVLTPATVEITTLRRDVSTDGRRATVTFTDDWRADAARRDFTVNALYADMLTGEVFDYFGGVDDLAAGVIRFIGAPLERIAEDHLRILRFFRFHARFGKGAPGAASLTACTARANDLMALSRERIADELLKLLALPDPAPTIRSMIEHGIFTPVLPEISAIGVLESLGDADAVLRLSSLLPANPDVTDTVAKRLKLSKAINKRLVLAAGRCADDATDPRRLAYKIGMEAARDRLTLLGERSALAALDGWELPRFPMSGGTLVARGIKEGPEVARILKAIEEQWISEGFPDAARVQKLANELT